MNLALVWFFGYKTSECWNINMS